MALYLDLSDSGGSDLAWMYTGHAVRLGYSVGGLLFPFNGSER
jgi:hypothetical protein